MNRDPYLVPTRPSSTTPQNGQSLLEILIATAVGALLILAAASVIASATGIWPQEPTAPQVEKGFSTISITQDI